MKIARREAALAALGSLLVVLLLLGFNTQRVGLYKDDARQYALMADDLTVSVRLPYNFRVLTPAIVHVMPLPRETAFTIVTALGLSLTGLFGYLYLRALALEWPVASCSTLLLLASGVGTRMLTTPFYVDALTYASEASTLWALQARRERLAIVALVLGTLNRETALLLLPVYWLQAHAWRAQPALASGAGDRWWLRVASLSALPAIALAVVIVLRVAAAGGLAALDQILWTKERTFEQNIPSVQEWFDVFSLFGMLWVLAALHLRDLLDSRVLPLVRRSLAFGLLVILQLTVSRGDESRNLSHLVMIVVPLAALELRRWWNRAGGGLLLLVGVLACLASMVNFRWTAVPVTSVRYAIVGLGSGVVCLVCCVSRRTAATITTAFRGART
ncbi:MAG: hypothetical protein IT307_02205 [Chloroflexi bacterium]|nr:hypothetical protein [Chloroflexota bacterium]